MQSARHTSKDLLYRDLKFLIRRNPSLKMQIASHFGLISTTTIDQWFSRGRLPLEKREELKKLMEVLKNGKKTSKG